MKIFQMYKIKLERRITPRQEIIETKLIKNLLPFVQLSESFR